MGVKKQVFASNAERGNFIKLKRQWGSKYNIYHNLPFLHIFDTENVKDISDRSWKHLKFSKIEMSRLKKTSVDYTFCNEADEPLICIDFDGYQEGYNIGTKYHFETAKDPWKETIYDLKLKVAHGSWAHGWFFPYFVLGSKEFKDLPPDIGLTIVDGIIGEVLASKASRAKFAEGFNPEEIGFTQEQFDEFDPDTRHELIQDWIIGVEVEMDFEHNPIYKKSAELSHELGILGHSVQGIRPPEVDKAANWEERIKLFNTAFYYGAKVGIDSKDQGKIEASITLRNFKTPHFSGIGLAEEIALILALLKLKNLRKRKSGQS